MFKILVQVKYFLLLACIFRVAMAKWCTDHGNCVDCTNAKTWSGDHCRWCKRDNECHAKGSLVNPCKRAENIVDESHCGDELSRYIPDLSYKMLLLSSAAYDRHDPQRCLDESLPSSAFKVLTVITRECDFSQSAGKCSGFVATSEVEKAIIVAFRGSASTWQALKVFLEGILSPKTSFLGGEVQTYWNRAFTVLWGCMKSDVIALRSKYPNYKLWVTGHSLGGAIASLASTWIAYNNIAPRKDIILYTFGMPRVGNYDYALQHDRLVRNSWRVVNYDDYVPHFPSMASINIFNGPYHHGVEAYYTSPAISVNSNHKECHDKPFNEDKSCSFTTFPYSLENHKEYFSIPVGTHCPSFSRDTPAASNNTQPKFKFLKGHCSVYRYENGSYALNLTEKAAKSSAKRNAAGVWIGLAMNIIAVINLSYRFFSV